MSTWAGVGIYLSAVLHCVVERMNDVSLRVD